MANTASTRLDELDSRISSVQVAVDVGSIRVLSAEGAHRDVVEVLLGDRDAVPVGVVACGPRMKEDVGHHWQLLEQERQRHRH